MTQLERTSPWDDSPAVKRPAQRAWYARRLTPEDSAELLAQMALLADRGLPLPAGLRALAEEEDSGRVGRAFRSLAGQLEAGKDFPTALNEADVHLPDAERAVIVAAVKSGRFAEVIEEFLENRQRSRELHRRIRNLLTYPAIVGVFCFLLLASLDWMVVSNFRQIYEDFGADLPAITVAVVTISEGLTYSMVGALGGLLLVWVLVLVGTGPSFRRRLAYRLPLIGRMWRYTVLAEFSYMAGLLTSCSVPLPDALHFAAGATGDADLKETMARITQELLAGKALGARLAAESRLPAGLAQIVSWGEDRTRLAEALKLAGEMFEARSQAQFVLAGVVFPPFTLSIVLLLVGFVAAALMMPMINLIEKLA